ncbi:MAG: glycosyltransferase family 2 protein [Clostridia bacterium]|nr:glycosyltransferase family 2 protein [Clostridia bacterium]
MREPEPAVKGKTKPGSIGEPKAATLNKPEPAVTVLIPAFNEDTVIARTVAAARALSGVTRVIVVDDGSTDKTAEAAAAAGAEVIKAGTNRGKGYALKLGVQTAQEGAAQGEATQEGFLLILDADLGETAGEGEKILAPVLAGKADLCIGRFPAPRKKAGCGLVRNLAAVGISLLTGLKVTAPLSGQRALSPKALAALGNRFAPGFGVETGMIIDLARKKLVIKEVPVEMTHRETGWDLKSCLHRARQFWDVLQALAGRRV